MAIRYSFFSFFVFISLITNFEATAQTNSSTEIQLFKEIPTKTSKPYVLESENKTPYQQPYIIKDKELATYFTSGSIPASFPLYDYNLSKKENKILIKDWCMVEEHFKLLTPEAQQKFEEKILTESNK